MSTRSTRSTDTIRTSPGPNQAPPSPAPVSRRTSGEQGGATRSSRQPASPRQSADLRQPTSQRAAPAKRSPRAGGSSNDDGQTEVQARERARAEARRRTQARVRPVDAARAGSVRDAGTNQRAARGMPMDRLSLPLRELHERHARLARTLDKSEKTITWYRGSLEDFCRFLEGPEQVPAPATLCDFTLERVRDYILYLRGRPTFGGSSEELVNGE